MFRVSWIGDFGMGKNGSVIVLLFFFMIVLCQSDAFDSRKLVATTDPNGSQDSPSSSPPSVDKKSNVSSVETSNPNDSPNTRPSNSGDLKQNQGKNQDGNEPKTISKQSCKGLPSCSDNKKTMIACIQDFVNGSKNLSLGVQNEKDLDLKVKITFGISENNELSAFEVPANGTTTVNITLSGDKSNKIILNAGNGDCELQISPSKSKNPKNTSNPKDGNDPADTPAKPNDVNSPVESPTKPKEENSPPKEKKGDNPSNSKDVKDPSKPKEINDPSKPKEIDDPSKSKDVIDPSKSKEKSPPSNPEINVDTPISQNNFLDQLKFYSKQVTPIYGVYLAFLVTLIIGGSWALCTFRKRRTRNEVAYQELEMEPSNAVDVETAEGWEHDWDDDDWDKDEDIQSASGGVQTKSISSNGLTSRATKKDGWDADWDD